MSGNIPYIINIPFATHNPSADQPNMEIDTNSSNQIWGIDHIPFNANYSGTHKQITFSSNNPPSVPTTFPILFTNTKDGAGNNLPSSLAQMFLYSGTAAQGQNQYVSTANGSTFLLGGIILKWGKVTAANNNTTVPFPVAFPNNCFSVIVSGGTPSGTQPTVNINPASVGTTLFVIKMVNGPSDVFYVAIGN